MYSLSYSIVEPYIGIGVFLLSCGLSLLIVRRRSSRSSSMTDTNGTEKIITAHYPVITKKNTEYFDVSVQGINRYPMRSVLGTFTSSLEARLWVSQRRKSENVKSLNGVWQFRLFDKTKDALDYVDSVTKDTECVLGAYTPLLVPSSWQVQTPGDLPIYTNIKYIIPVDPPNLPELNLTGYFRTKMSISKDWLRDRKVFLCFGGCDCALYAWINGHFVGFSKDSRLPAEFDVTQFLHAATQTDDNEEVEFEVEAVVPRFSDGYYLEDQDMYNLSGLFREVEIYTLPAPVSIFDFRWYSDLSDDYSAAELSVEVLLEVDRSCLESPQGGGYAVQCSLFEEGIMTASYETIDPAANGLSSYKDITHNFVFSSSDSYAGHSTSRPHARTNPVAVTIPTYFSMSELDAMPDCSADTLYGRDSIDEAKFEGYVKCNKLVAVQLRLIVADPLLWCTEKPCVYTLVISLSYRQEALSGSEVKDSTESLSGLLRDSRDEVLQAESARVGFRRIVIDADNEVHQGLLTINDRSVMIKGINTHEHDQLYGHTISPHILEADLRLLKRNNFNAIRTSHYPQVEWFYELCTLYGVYVIDESNIETHGMKPYAGRLSDDPVWLEAYMLRLSRMYFRDKNHPSIIAWSLGNESGYGKNHQLMARWIRSIDDSRFILYEPASYGSPYYQSTFFELINNGESKTLLFDERNQVVSSKCTKKKYAVKNTSSQSIPKVEESQGVILIDLKDDFSDKHCMATDILCPMYMRMGECVALSQRFPRKPLIQVEFEHMMGNGGGNVKENWECMRSKVAPYRYFQGGFVWDYADQGIVATDSQFRSKWHYGGDFGEVEHDSNFNINGIVWPDRGLDFNIWQVQPPYLTMHDIITMTCKLLASDAPEFYNSSSESEVNKLVAAVCETVLRLVYGRWGANTRYDKVIKMAPYGLSTRNKQHINSVGSVKTGGLTVSGVPAHHSNEQDVFEENLLNSTDLIVRTLLTGNCDRNRSLSLSLSRSVSMSADITGDDDETHRSMCVETAISKPNMIETKNCMRSFDCNVIKLIAAGFSASSETVPLQLPPLTSSQTLSVRLKLNLLNYFDHITELSEELVFDSLLLYNGIIVSSCSLSKLGATIPPTFEAVSMEIYAADFSMRTYEVPNLSTEWLKGSNFCGAGNVSKIDLNAMSVVLGLSCPETLLLDHDTLDETKRLLQSLMDGRLPDDITTDQVWWSDIATRPSTITSTTTSLHALDKQWTVLVVGRLRCNTSYAVAGYPMGSSQYNLTAAMNHGILQSTLLMKSPPRSPSKIVTNSKGAVLLNMIMGATSSPVHATSAITFIPNATKDSYDIQLCTVGGEHETRVVISSDTGMLEALFIEGINVLAEPAVGSSVKPSRLQFHRSPTDNDRYGYTCIWSAIGLDREMVYLPVGFIGSKSSGENGIPSSATASGCSSGISIRSLKQINDKLNKATDSSILHSQAKMSTEYELKSLLVYQSDTVEFERLNDLPDRSVIVRCSWILAPAHLDRVKLRIIREVLRFFQNKYCQETYVSFSAKAEVVYINLLAGAFRLGRETLGTAVRLWKPVLFMCSTIRAADCLCGAPEVGNANEMVPVATDSPEDEAPVCVRVTLTYSLSPSGDLSMDCSLDASAMVTMLPRVGLQLNLRQDFQRFVWNGLGPHECYPDRKSSAVPGIHMVNSTRAFFTPYVKPGECGNRADCQWVQACQGQAQSQDSRPIALRFSGKDNLLHFSALPYGTEELSRNHSTEVEYFPCAYTALNLDHRIMGVGGDDTWSSCVHEEYLVAPAVYNFSVCVSLF